MSAKIAAQTVLKMVMRIEALEGQMDIAAGNSFGRYVAVKEQHADLVKHEVDILWHDYFKPEHLEKYPDLHTTVWNATKLASANKQNVDLDSAKAARRGRGRDRGHLLGHQGSRVLRPGLGRTLRHVAASRP